MKPVAAGAAGQMPLPTPGWPPELKIRGWWFFLGAWGGPATFWVTHSTPKIGEKSNQGFAQPDCHDSPRIWVNDSQKWVNSGWF